MGRHSNGCRVCVRRRVKCDERLPMCRNCERTGKPCDGPKTSSKFVINTPASIAGQEAATGDAPIDIRSHMLRPDVRDEAIAVFFGQFVLPTGRRRARGYLAFLPRFWLYSNDDCLNSAVEAVAYANFVNQRPSKQVRTRACRTYAKALSCVNAALSDPARNTMDGTMMAVILLGILELITVEKPKVPDVHGSGLCALLRLRGSEQLSTTEGKDMFRLAFIYVIVRGHATQNRLGPIEVALMEQFIHDVTQVSAALGKALMGGLKICQLTVEAEEVLQYLTALDIESGNDQHHHSEMCLRLLELVREMEALDDVHWAWKDDSPDLWRCQAVGVDNHANPVHSYSDPWTCSVWNWTRSARLLLQSTILRAVEQLQHFAVPVLEREHREQTAREKIRLMAQDICASVPYLMGRVASIGTQEKMLDPGASPDCNSLSLCMLLWHFSVIEHSGLMTAEDQAVIDTTTKEIAAVRGIKHAVAKCS